MKLVDWSVCYCYINRLEVDLLILIPRQYLRLHPIIHSEYNIIYASKLL